MDMPSDFAKVVRMCATEEWYDIACKRRLIGPGRTHDLRQLEPTWRILRAGRPLHPIDLDELLDKTHFGEFWKFALDLRSRGTSRKKNLAAYGLPE